MSGTTPPGSPPPEVPEEFAAAYRAAYEQALAAQTDWPQHREFPETPHDTDDPPDAADDETDLPVRRGPIRVGTHRSEEDDDESPTWFERIRDSTWFVPLLLALLALLLILGAYAAGRRFADRVSGDAEPDAQPRVVIGEGDSGNGRQPVTNQKPGEGAWAGKVRRLGGIEATVGCTAKAGVESSGEKVTYGAANLVDGAADTTWRCNGSAIGEKITFDLGREVPIGQVGLIPGYAKTDEQSGADRFAENNRVTRVRWTIGDVEVVQRMSGAADDRNLQLLRVPRTRTETVELEILALRKGPRDTTAISEILLGRAG